MNAGPKEKDQQRRPAQVVVAPAGVAHKLVNSGPGRLRQVDMHADGQFATERLES